MRNSTEYNRIHKWLERDLEKTGECFYCQKKGRTEWSNIDHQYRQDPTEYQEVCTKCHYYFDKLMLNGRRGKPKGYMNTDTWMYWNPIEDFYPA